MNEKRNDDDERKKAEETREKKLWSHQSSCIIYGLECNDEPNAWLRIWLMGCMNAPQHNVKYDTFCAKMYSQWTEPRSHRILRQWQALSIIVESILWQFQCEIDQRECTELHAYRVFVSPSSSAVAYILYDEPAENRFHRDWQKCGRRENIACLSVSVCVLFFRLLYNADSTDHSLYCHSH